MTAKSTFRTLRLVASFALLGAVVTGVVFGWAGEDVRTYGAAAGGTAAALLKAINII